MAVNLRTTSSTLGFGAILLFVAVFWAGQKYAGANQSVNLIKLATTPIGVTLNPESRQVKTADASQAKKPPSRVAIAAPVTGGASQRPAEDVVRLPVRSAPASNTPETAPRDRAANGGMSVATVNKTDETLAPVTTTEPTPAPPPTEARPSMQKGGLVEGGRQTPGLQLINLSTADIRRLVAGGKAYIVAENEVTGAMQIFESFDRPFRSGRDVPEGSMSTRYVRISDPVLRDALQIRLGRLPTEKFVFGMRFSRGFDAAIVDRQFASLAARSIDFEQALASGKTIITRGSIAPDLDFKIEDIIVE